VLGAYRVIRHVFDNGSVVRTGTVRQLTGAQAAMAWDCGKFLR
jgi:hypothetical protein